MLHNTLVYYNPLVIPITDVDTSVRSNSYAIRITKLIVTSSNGAKGLYVVLVFVKD